MSGRTLGLVDAFHQYLPETAREAFAVLTQLGDTWFLVVAVALLYWFGDRRRGAFALAAVFGALSLTLALKGLFALPRPPAELHAGHASGYGFPSGHAIGATVLWGLLALLVERGSRSQRAVVAAVVVAVVATSRVAIGVHYAADVLVGVAVGLTYLAVLVRWGRWNPGRAFALAAVLGLAALATNGLVPDAVAAAAAVLAAGGAWAAFDAPPSQPMTVPVAVAGLAVFGALGFAGNELALPLAAVFALNAAIPVGILSLPTVVARVKKTGLGTPT